jgi:hypothetical protein
MKPLLTWRETQQLIKVIAEAGCIPFVRVPSANVGDILKAVDAGALGIVVPMVETVQEARNAVTFAKYPIGNRDYPNTKPWGHRSSGGGQARSLWGRSARRKSGEIPSPHLHAFATWLGSPRRELGEFPSPHLGRRPRNADLTSFGR